jgi:Flp pilus assembly pilin Flp
MMRSLRDMVAVGDRGASAVEYAVLVSLIAIFIVASVFVFGSSVSGLFERAGDCTVSPETPC